MKQHFLYTVCLISILGFTPVVYAQNAASELNTIKKQPDTYLWAECTAATLEEAKANAVLLLQAKLENNVPLPQDKMQTLYCMRGDMYRVLVFVNTSTLQSAGENNSSGTTVLVNLPPQSQPQASASPQSVSLPVKVETSSSSASVEQYTHPDTECNKMLRQMLTVTTAEELSALYQQWKSDGLVFAYGNKRNIPLSDCYIFVYNRAGRICAYLYQHQGKVTDVLHNKEQMLSEYLTSDYGLFWIH